MTQKDEALRMAIEALEDLAEFSMNRERIEKIITEGKTALSEPETVTLPDGWVADARRYQWLKENYHGFEMFRNSPIPYVSLDSEIDKAMLASAPTLNEKG